MTEYLLSFTVQDTRHMSRALDKFINLKKSFFRKILEFFLQCGYNTTKTPIYFGK